MIHKPYRTEANAYGFMNYVILALQTIILLCIFAVVYKNYRLMNKTLLLTAAISVLLSGNVAAKQDLTILEDYTMTQGISPGGRYVVGVNPQYSAYGTNMVSFVYDITTGEISWPTYWDENDKGKGGQINSINDNGVMCGTAKNPDFELTIQDYFEGEITWPINVATVWENGTRVNLPYGDLDTGAYGYLEDGTFGIAISADGNTVAGYSSTGNGATYTPCMWTKDENGVWSLTILPMPEGCRSGRVVDMSSDGSIILGTVTQNYVNYGAYWKDGQCHLMSGTNDESELSEYFSIKVFDISPNGKYITISLDRKGRVYDVENDAYRKMSSFDEIGNLNSMAVDNNGNVTGAFGYGSVFFGGEVYTRPFWYNYKEDRLFDLNYYISLFASNIDTDYSFRYEDRTQALPVVVSGDGNVIVGDKDTYMFLEQIPTVWVLQSEQRDIMFPAMPEITSAKSENFREVELAWDKDSQAYDGLTLTSYNIYRDGELIKSVDATEEHFIVTLTGEPAGHPEYTIEAVFTDADGNEVYSPKSNPSKVSIPETYDLPLMDNFDSGSLDTNYWTIDIDYADSNNGGWGAVVYTGLVDKGLYSSVFDNSPYSTNVISRPMDATNETSVKLSFAIRYELINDQTQQVDKDTLSIEVTTDKGATWKEVKSFTLAELPTDWSMKEIDLSDYVAGKLFQLKLRRHGIGTTFYSLYMDILSVTSSGEMPAPESLSGVVTKDKNVNLIWKTSSDSYSLTHMNNLATYKRTIGNEVIAANSFSGDDLSAYNGKYLSAVSAYINFYEWYEVELGIHASVVVYEDGKLVCEKEMDDIVYNAYNTVVLDNPLLIDDSKELKIGLKIFDYDADQIPITYAITDDYIAGKSDLYSEDGGVTWQRLSDFYADQENMESYGHCAWDITGHITDTPEFIGNGFEKPLCYNVFRNGEQINKLSIDGGSTRFTDNAPVDNACYEVVAYYLDGTKSDASEEFCLGYLDGISSAVLGDVTIRYDLGQGIVSIDGRFDRVVLYNINGQPVATTRGNVLSVNSLPAGVYVINVESGDSVRTQKIVVR